jgi:transcriptional regulator with XRE-family HTH domain
MVGLGETIKALRVGLGLSQGKLGNLVGVSRAAVSAWETGANAPRGKRLQKLATALDTTVPDMMAGKARAVQKASGTVIAVQSDGHEIPVVTVKSIEPALWTKSRQRMIVVEEKSGRRFAIVATDETIQALTSCLEALRELL